MTCLIIDDEPIAREIISSYAQNIPGLEVLASFSNALEAAEFHKAKPADLFFLDINMPIISGMEMLKALNNRPLVIFTTAYPQFALESYDVEAVDYLVKPIPFERFYKAYQKAEARLHPPLDAKEPAKSFLVLKSDKKWHQIAHCDITYIQSMGDFVKVITPEKTIIASETMKNLEEQLPPQLFFRCHKSYIINRSKIEYLEGNSLKIGKTTLPIGPIFRENFIEWLKS